MNTGEVVELFEGGWLQLGEGLPQARVIVARHRAPAPGKPVRVGKRIGEWVYELFITTLTTDGFLVEDVLDLYHGRGAFEAVLADEDVEEDPTAGAPTRSVGRNSGKLRVNGCGTCASHWERRCRGASYVRSSGHPPKNRLPCLVAGEDVLKSMDRGSGQQAWTSPRTVRGRCFHVARRRNAALSSGASLWLSEVRQENAFTQRAVYLASQTDCQRCSLREQCWHRGQRDRARRLSAVRRLLPPLLLYLLSESRSCSDHPVGGCGWSSASPHLDRPLAQAICRGASAGGKSAKHFSSPSPTSGRSASSPLELARSARMQCLVGTTAVAHHCRWRSRFSYHQRA